MKKTTKQTKQTKKPSTRSAYGVKRAIAFTNATCRSAPEYMLTRQYNRNHKAIQATTSLIAKSIDVPENEEWALVPYHHDYAVSTHGRVTSLKRGGVKLLSATNGHNGYRYVHLHGKTGVTTACVHKLVASAFIGKAPAGCALVFKDGDVSNAAVSNLAYVRKASARGVVVNTDDPRVSKGCVPSTVDEAKSQVRDHVVLQYAATGEFLSAYNNVAEAAVITGVKASKIIKSARGLTTKTESIRRHGVNAGRREFSRWKFAAEGWTKEDFGTVYTADEEAAVSLIGKPFWARKTA